MGGEHGCELDPLAFVHGLRLVEQLALGDHQRDEAAEARGQVEQVQDQRGHDERHHQETCPAGFGSLAFRTTAQMNMAVNAKPTGIRKTLRTSASCEAVAVDRAEGHAGGGGLGDERVYRREPLRPWSRRRGAAPQLGLSHAWRAASPAPNFVPPAPTSA
eukprot:CAMPEP_0179927580 /NCGR_PEP_ID=MMETSP0983-20121128/8407_1 /TAXON_ID=483367 /ORGANISM="non described non described, Strain CCMP 2436" /LENGTH=159 /DNA_ID=CAMNT_0021831321 /DNA_START=332 /DNA_END=807 /DNA_ORIENTATION=+